MSENVRVLLHDLRRGLRKQSIVIVDTWNVPYSTGTFFVSQKDISDEEVAKFAEEHVHFPFWPIQLVGKLWAKETWDD